MDLKKFLLCLILCLGAGGIGSFFTIPSINTWYAVLRKPPTTPPNWVFWPVWTGLYIMMSIALYTVWQKRGPLNQGKIAAYLWFGMQLFLNVLWTVVFFWLHSLLGGLLLIVVLWLTIAITIKQFSKQAPSAACLLVPYLLWVSYASFLNYSLWRLNNH